MEEQEYINDTDLRIAIDEVLARPEFQSETLETSLWDTLMENIFEQLSEWSEQLSPKLPSFLKDFDITLFFLILSILANLFIGYRFVKRYMRNDHKIFEPQVSSNELVVDLKTDAEEAFKQAVTGGQAREALWYLHRYWLHKLNNQKQLQFCKWKSNGKYLLECSQPQFEQLSALYAQTIYGGNGVKFEALTSFLEMGSIAEAVSKDEALTPAAKVDPIKTANIAETIKSAGAV